MPNDKNQSSLRECAWLSDLEWFDIDSDSGKQQLIATLSDSGHELVREHGIHELEQRLQPELSTSEGLKLRSQAGPWPDAPAAGARRFPRVFSRIEDLTTLRLLLDIDADLAWFRGHFPGNPVLPGVVQLHWAISIAQTCFGYLDTPNEILRLKFKSIVTPPRVVELALSRPRTGEVQFDYSGLGQQFSQGRLKFAVNTQ